MLKFKRVPNEKTNVTEEYEVWNESGNMIGRVFYDTYEVLKTPWMFSEYIGYGDSYSSMLVDDMEEIVNFTKESEQRWIDAQYGEGKNA